MVTQTEGAKGIAEDFHVEIMSPCNALQELFEEVVCALVDSFVAMLNAHHPKVKYPAKTISASILGADTLSLGAAPV